MIVRAVFALLLVVLAVAGAVRYAGSQQVNDWLHPKPRLKIEFDNGTVREPPAADSGAASAPPGSVRGTPKKCQRGSEVTYTDGPCPRGTKELPLSNGTVTVLQGQGPAKVPGAASTAARRSTLHDVLDDSEQPSLRDRRIERIVNR